MKLKYFTTVSATVVAGALLIAPTAAIAAPVSTSVQGQPVAAVSLDDGQITPSEAANYIDQINASVTEIKQAQELEPKADWAKEINKLIATAAELTQSLEVIANGGISLANPTVVLARTHLVVEIGTTIRNSTQNLSNKIQKAHVELGFAVTRAVLRVVNLGATADQLNESVADLKQTYERVSTYRDLLPTDTATIYVKAKLDKAIWDTRVARDKNILGKKGFQVYNTLNRQITKAVGVWFKASSTVQDVEDAIANLEAAYATAEAAPNVK